MSVAPFITIKKDNRLMWELGGYLFIYSEKICQGKDKMKKRSDGRYLKTIKDTKTNKKRKDKYKNNVNFIFHTITHL